MRLLLCVTVPIILRSQSAVEYLPPSSPSVRSDAGDQFRVGVCHLDAGFVSCMSSYYPGVLVFIIVLCPLVLWVMCRRH
jgi:hypothetical protein